MNDEQAPRRAYFASLATPDLIVCATVERERYSATDLELITEELSRRGVDTERLVVPAAGGGQPLGVTPTMYSAPLPAAVSWCGAILWTSPAA